MLTTILYGFLIVVATVVAALVGLALSQRLIPLHLIFFIYTATC